MRNKLHILALIPLLMLASAGIGLGDKGDPGDPPFTPVLSRPDGTLWKGFYFNDIDTYRYKCADRIEVERVGKSYNVEGPCEDRFIVQDVLFTFSKPEPSGYLQIDKLGNSGFQIDGRDVRHLFQMKSNRDLSLVILVFKISGNKPHLYLEDDGVWEELKLHDLKETGDYFATFSRGGRFALV